MLYTAFLLLLAIGAILLCSARWKFNTFFVLFAVSVGVGLAAGLDGEEVIKLLKTGMGKTLEKVGLLIILGTTLGLLLEKTGATISLANYLLKKTGPQNAPLALTLVAFTVGLPIFCDSGFVVLIGLVLMLGRQMPPLRLTLVLCLAAALYSVHCLVPPHPGISAAAAVMKVDLGKAMLLGTLLAIPGTIAGYFWAKYAGKKYLDDYQPDAVAGLSAPDAVPFDGTLPAPWQAFLPIMLPIALIALKSVYLLDPANAHAGWVSAVIRFIGEPVTALFVGILLVLPLLFRNNLTTELHGVTRSYTERNPKLKTQNSKLNNILEASIEKSGPILAIIAMGGAFGEVIKALDLGGVYGSALTGGGLGIFVPFLLAVIFKTAQGSSTVAVMSAAAIVEPMVAPLGLDGEWGRLLSLMSMGAGSMMLSHANDAYFWVIARFSHMDTGLTLRAYSVASALLGMVTFLTILILFWAL